MVQVYIPSMDTTQALRTEFVPDLFKIPEILQLNKPTETEGWQMGDPFMFLFFWKIKLKFLLDSLPFVFLNVFL